jgi:pyruvate dehydrogenase E1 component beta subunit
MSISILMPALSPTMEEGKLAKWLVREGDEVHSGDILAEIETDKATMEFEAVDEGRIGKILIPEGTEGVKVNEPIAVLVQAGESVSDGPADSNGKRARPVEPKAQMPKPEASKPAAISLPAEGVKEIAEPEVPAGTEFANITVREALRDAMAEEMRRDETVFLMGDG